MKAMLLFVTDIDGTVFDGVYSGSGSGSEFAEVWERHSEGALLAYNTGRSLADGLELIERTELPQPDYFIGSVGTEIYDYSQKKLLLDWNESLVPNWEPGRIDRLVPAFAAGCERQPLACQSEFKRSWFWRDQSEHAIARLKDGLTAENISAQVVYSSSLDLDLLPLAANKGNALCWLAAKLGIAITEVVVAGDSGNDVSMFEPPGVRGIVVANAEPNLRRLIDQMIAHSHYLASMPCAAGVAEGLTALTAGRNHLYPPLKLS